MYLNRHSTGDRGLPCAKPIDPCFTYVLSLSIMELESQVAIKSTKALSSMCFRSDRSSKLCGTQGKHFFISI
uniref:Uncharacterized protein n=1 Tax=Picea sitchensis TaxID=3332 RepID=A0A6B9XRN0_PICSI|nr:hypothetical protein Q903MT_gene6628 [Picea sitchensis]